MWRHRKTGKAVWETGRPFSCVRLLAEKSDEPRGGPGGGIEPALAERLDLLLHECEDFRRRGIRRAGGERRRRIVFEPELDHLRGLAVDHDRDQGQREIDARGDAAAGDAVAIDAD